jgi:UDP-glucose 4-epimerase
MKILITGGAGCLGTNLLEHWLPQGHELFIIDNFATGKKAVVENVQGLELVEGDISDVKLMHDCFSTFKPEIVIHSAASYKDPNDWESDAKTNILGSINTVKYAKEFGAKKIINFQTALCFGRPTKTPIPRDHNLNPFTSYGISKAAGERYMLLEDDINVVSLRLANICGPRLAIGPIPTFYKRLKAGASCFCSDTYRDFLDMQDFLNLMDTLLDNEGVSGVFNVSSGEEHSIKEIYNLVSEYLGLPPSDVPIVPPGEDDVARVSLDPSETEKTFGWKAQVSFKDTISRQLSWYDQFGISDVFSHLKKQ